MVFDPFKLAAFLASGLPALAAAIALNYVFVRVLGWPAPLAYPVVLLFQMSANFFVCRRFVFDTHPNGSLWRQYLGFMSGIGAFRIADWALYTVLVEWVHVWFLFAQVFNGALFVLMKYRFVSGLLEKPASGCDGGASSSTPRSASSRPVPGRAERRPTAG